MPNGGPRPDCLHCKNCLGDRHDPETLTCGVHHFKVTNPIYAFCAAFMDYEVLEAVDWLDQELVRNRLEPDQMYLWLSLEVTDPTGKGKHIFDFAKLTSIDDYRTWDRERFYDAIGELAEAKREIYKAQGYKFD